MKEADKLAKLEAEIARLRHQLVTDELTGVLNRRGLMEALDPILKEVRYHLQFPGRRRGIFINNFSLVLVDLDHFKQVNDRYGHLAGDLALKTVAGILRKNLRGLDIVGRYGGEEIVIGLLGANLEDALTIADNLRAKIAETKLSHNGIDFSVTASFGVAVLKADTSIDELIEQADSALYKAKRSGRNRVVGA